ncbi:MAG: hypothetical protein V3W41_05495 [Planctomycetota bacterium]
MKLIIGHIRDIQPNKKTPHLELYFDRRDSSSLPHGDKEPVDLFFGQEKWRGTIRTTTSNPPYFHTSFEGVSGRLRGSDLFPRFGFKAGDDLTFEVLAVGELKLHHNAE